MRKLSRRAGIALALVLAAATLLGATTGVEAQPAPPPCVDDAPCLLTAGLPGADVMEHQVSPDGRWAVLFHAVNDGRFEAHIYGVPVRGGSPVRLDNANVVQLGRVMVSPDSTRVVYEAQVESAGPWHLFSVPIQGPAAASRRIANDISPLGGLGVETRISPDSRLVVFTPANRDRLRVVPIAGPANAGARLTDAFVPDGTVSQFHISADSRDVVYRATQDSAAAELYRVPLTPTPDPDPPTTKLNGPLAGGGGVRVFSLAPNNGRVVYLANEVRADTFELFSVTLGGGGRTKVNAPLPAFYDVVSPSDGSPIPAGITPDGTRVVYETVLVLDDLFDHRLYSAPIAGPGSSAVRLDDEAVTDPDADEVRYVISGDSKRVVHWMQRRASNGPAPEANWLFSVPVAGPASAGFALAEPRPRPFTFTVSPDGRRVVWELFTANDAFLYSTPAAGPARDRQVIDGPEDPRTVTVSPDSTRVLYRTTAAAGADLSSTAITGAGAPRRLTEGAGFAAIDPRYTVTSDGRDQMVVFAAEEETRGGFHLYSLPID